MCSPGFTAVTLMAGRADEHEVGWAVGTRRGCLENEALPFLRGRDKQGSPALAVGSGLRLQGSLGVAAPRPCRARSSRGWASWSRAASGSAAVVGCRVLNRPGAPQPLPRSTCCVKMAFLGPRNRERGAACPGSARRLDSTDLPRRTDHSGSAGRRFRSPRHHWRHALGWGSAPGCHRGLLGRDSEMQAAGNWRSTGPGWAVPGCLCWQSQRGIVGVSRETAERVRGLLREDTRRHLAVPWET